jgi:pimeloyl-ACP methyl ester carboxylesterase
MDRFTTSDGVAVAYHEFPPAGPAADLPTVVLQHGFAADSIANWVVPGVVGALTAAGRRVLAVDARGHGASDKPHDSARYGEARMARDITELLGALAIPEIDLVGYSMGGIISLIVASNDGRVRRLVVGGIGAGVAEMGGVERHHLDNVALASALRAEDPTTIVDPVAKSFRRFAESTGADRLALAAQAERVHRDGIALSDITAPTLVLVGVADPLAARPEVLAAAIPDAIVRLIGGDHLGAVASPDFAPSIVSFLAA